MANRAEGLDEKIKKAAWDEFLAYGFKDASTNRIAKNAGATSGAIYTRYADKDSIFKSLVEETLHGLEQKIQSYQNEYAALKIADSWDALFAFENKVLNELLDYLYDHLNASRLLICHSEGSSVSGFADEWIKFKHTRAYEFSERKCTGKPVEKEEFALLASAQYHCLFEVIRSGYSKEQAKRYMQIVQEVYAAGFKSLFDIRSADETI